MSASRAGKNRINRLGQIRIRTHLAPDGLSTDQMFGGRRCQTECHLLAQGADSVLADCSTVKPPDLPTVLFSLHALTGGASPWSVLGTFQPATACWKLPVSWQSAQSNEAAPLGSGTTGSPVTRISGCSSPPIDAPTILSFHLTSPCLADVLWNWIRVYLRLRRMRTTVAKSIEYEVTGGSAATSTQPHPQRGIDNRAESALRQRTRWRRTGCPTGARRCVRGGVAPRSGPR